MALDWSGLSPAEEEERAARGRCWFGDGSSEGELGSDFSSDVDY